MGIAAEPGLKKTFDAYNALSDVRRNVICFGRGVIPREFFRINLQHGIKPGVFQNAWDPFVWALP